MNMRQTSTRAVPQAIAAVQKDNRPAVAFAVTASALLCISSIIFTLILRGAL